MHITEEEMDALKIPPEERDYCTHFLRDYYDCIYNKRPLNFLCNREKHAYKHCRQEE